ncbi:MAG: transcription antitermination factor NusB [Clostridia bacterium]|nr:transcription antitermination factor NusB [Clostridia bacterium]
MDRRNARACAMKLVYEWELGGDGGNETLTGLLDIMPDEPEADFMNQLVEGVIRDHEELDEKIASFLQEGWKLERLSRVDRAILLIAAYELTKTDLADSIVINEAVELAHQYSTDKAGAFINGVLGSLARSLKNE